MLTVRAVEGIGEVVLGTDLATLLDSAQLADGDVLLVTSKVVSKSEGRVREGDREEAIDAETVRVVARRGPTRIVQNRLGLVMAAAGVDASNVEAGQLVLLPEDPDRSARELRRGIADRFGVTVAVVVTDTAGRAWRTGQTDIAIGVAGLEPLASFAGSTDSYGNQLAVTAPAVADELAGIAEVASGKLGGRPVVIVSGLADRVLPADQDGPGARALLRPAAEDLFGLGAREAVVTALAGERTGFGSPASGEELVAALERCALATYVEEQRVSVASDARGPVLDALLVAHGWQVVRTDGARVHLEPLS